MFDKLLADLNLKLDVMRLRFWTKAAYAAQDLGQALMHEFVQIGRASYNDVQRSVKYREEVRRNS